MKKIISLILSVFLIGSVTLYAESVILDTPYKDKNITLDIPSDYVSLKALTIQIAQLYWGERYDLEQTLSREQQLNNDLTKLTDSAGSLSATALKLNDSVTNLIKVYNQKPFFGFYVLSGATLSYQNLTQSLNIDIGVGTILGDKFMAQLIGGIPTPSLTLLLGWKF